MKGDKDLALFLEAVATADLSRFPVLRADPLPNDPQGKPTENRYPELVFWINAYNAHVVKALSDAYPINSPDDIKDFDTAQTRVVAGQPWSFRDMRKKISSFDPLALFTLTNGTVGGPILQPVAYRYYGIDEQLKNAAQNFVNDPRNVRLVRIKNTVTLNAYLLEFNEAFAPKSEPKKLLGVRSLLSAYAERRTGGSYFRTNDYRIDLERTDRSLNHQASDSAISGSVGGS
jgi:hypothetical protein